eukprot:3941400-Rhodomonas_salina.2
MPGAGIPYAANAVPLPSSLPPSYAAPTPCPVLAYRMVVSACAIFGTEPAYHTGASALYVHI